MSLVIAYVVIVVGLLFVGITIGAVLVLRHPSWLARFNILKEERSDEQ